MAYTFWCARPKMTLSLKFEAPTATLSFFFFSKQNLGREIDIRKDRYWIFCTPKWFMETVKIYGMHISSDQLKICNSTIVWFGLYAESFGCNRIRFRLRKHFQCLFSDFLIEKKRVYLSLCSKWQTATAKTTTDDWFLIALNGLTLLLDVCARVCLFFFCTCVCVSAFRRWRTTWQMTAQLLS